MTRSCARSSRARWPTWPRAPSTRWSSPGSTGSPRGLGTWLRVERVLLDHPGRLLVSVADGDCDPSDPASKFLLRQKAQMAVYELDQIKARVRRWHRQRAEHGWPLVSGRRPFGWVDSQRSAVEPVEAAVIEYV